MNNFNQELLNEGRACLVNAILAYGEGFKVMAPEEITEDLMETLNEGITAIEAMMPVLIAMWEMSNRLTGQEMSFIEFLTEVAEKKFGGGAD
jgi:hypothetical protein